MKTHVAFETVNFEYYDLGTEQDLKFSGTAYTGAVVEHYLGQEIVDVDTMTIFSKETNKVNIFKSHDVDVPLGHAFVKIEDGKVFIEEGFLYGDEGEKLYGMMKKGLDMELSIGFEANPDDVNQLAYGQYETVNGVEVTYPVNVWRNAQLNEISLVAFGADRNTHVKVYRAMKNYKAKGKEMAKKVKSFYECSCEEQKEQSTKLVDQVASLKDKRKEDEELYSLLSQVETILKGMGDYVDAKFSLDTVKADFAKVSDDLKAKNDEIVSMKAEFEQALVRLEEFDAKEAQRIKDEKKVKLSDAFNKLGKKVTDEVEAEFLSMTEKQFAVALEAMETSGKSFLFNKQDTGKPAGDVDEKALRAEAQRIRDEGLVGKKEVLKSYEMARKNLGL